MKTKFAKFIDNSIGAVIIFCAAAAIFRYYLPLSVSAFCAACVTSGALLLLSLRSKKNVAKEKLSKAADDMFYDFMFESQTLPATLLCKGLKSKGVNAVRHGDALYVGKTAAFFCFDAPPSDKAVARTIARAKHYGANKIILFGKSPKSYPSVDGFEFKCASGEDVYKLFGSLDCLPARKYNVKKQKRFSRFRGALDKDKILRYAALSAAFFAVAALTGRSVVTLACAIICALLFIVSATMFIVKFIKTKKRQNAA